MVYYKYVAIPYKSGINSNEQIDEIRHEIDPGRNPL